MQRPVPMVTFFIILLTIALILTSLFGVLIILMQRPSEDAGMGAALGGGAVTSIFGGEAGNILHRWTIMSTILFFVLSLVLSLLYMAREGKKTAVMKLIAAPESLAPVVPEQEAAAEGGPETPNGNPQGDAPEAAEGGNHFEENEAPEAAAPPSPEEVEPPEAEPPESFTYVSEKAAIEASVPEDDAAPPAEGDAPDTPVRLSGPGPGRPEAFRLRIGPPPGPE